MQKRLSKKKKLDLNELASSITEQATSDQPEEVEPVDPDKNPAAVALGRLGGLKGGKVRAKNMTKEQRSQAARKAAQARWKKR
ncbi:MAG: hypothetical protein SGI97_10175 [candidate division Zixibacteria bacterium]|nr:hypothetical protein [candidate division Zixibacteria bacterium]